MDISTICGIVGIIGTLSFGVLSVYFYKKNLKLNEEKRRIEYSDLMKASKGLKGKILKKFQPDVLFTPCRRGATIANLMLDVGENIPLYVGFREDLREDILKSPPKNYEIAPKTGKYNHYIPEGLLNENKDSNILVIDDFVDSGDSLKTIVEFLITKGFQRDKIKTATIVCTKTAIRSGKNSNFYVYEDMPYDFYFPWGRAR